jgi:hypothetical protein
MLFNFHCVTLRNQTTLTQLQALAYCVCSVRLFDASGIAVMHAARSALLQACNLKPHQQLLLQCDSCLLHDAHAANSQGTASAPHSKPCLRPLLLPS